MDNFELIADKDEEVGIGEHLWFGREDRTDDKLMHDKGVGEPVLIRLFEFKFPPTLEVLPTKEQILTEEYIKHLQTLLWGDSLRLVMTPRVEINKEGCKVFAPCQARTGSSFVEQPKTIQEWTR